MVLFYAAVPTIFYHRCCGANKIKVDLKKKKEN